MSESGKDAHEESPSLRSSGSVARERERAESGFRELAQQFRQTIDWARGQFSEVAYLLQCCETLSDVQAIFGKDRLDALGGWTSSQHALMQRLIAIKPVKRESLAELCGFNLVPAAAALVLRVIHGPLRIDLPRVFYSIKVASGARRIAPHARRDFWNSSLIPQLKADPGWPARGAPKDPWHVAKERSIACDLLADSIKGSPAPAVLLNVSPVQQQEKLEGLPQPRYQFKCIGNIWHVHFNGEAGTFSDDRKGFRIIAQLLRYPHPQVPTPSSDLLGIPPALAAARDDAASTAQASPRITPEAVAAAREWLTSQYPMKREAAVESADPAQIDQVEDYKDEVEKYLKDAEGLGGRIRSLGGKDAGRAAVWANMDRALREIAKAQPPLVQLIEHLKDSIHTEGNAYAYRPRAPIDWDL